MPVPPPLGLLFNVFQLLDIKQKSKLFLPRSFLNDDSVEINDPNLIAINFNDFFVNVGPKSHIFNLTFAPGKIPNDLKVALITPVYKASEKMYFRIIDPSLCCHFFPKYSTS